MNSKEARKTKEGWAEYMRSYRKLNPESSRNSDLLKCFGITLEQYTQIYDMQEGVCAICKKVETVIDNRSGLSRNLAVDHCHDTQRVRGLLCMACNQGIGNFREDVSNLASAIQYLETAKAVVTSKPVLYKKRGNKHRAKAPTVSPTVDLSTFLE